MGVMALGVNLVSSTALGSLYSGECLELRGAPPEQPQVTSFMVEDPCAECWDPTCVICLEDISTGCRAGKLPCGHVFHDECVRGWGRGRVPKRGARCDVPPLRASPRHAEWRIPKRW